jgi:hypothetical protein
MRITSVIFLVSLFILHHPLQAQINEVRISGSVSKLFKHSSKSLFEIPERSYTAELSFLYSATDKYDWGRYFGRPRIGFSFIYTDFGDKDILGYAVGAFPNIEYFFINRNRFSAGFQLGVGIAKLSRYYDIIENPLHNAIGSSWNNVSRLAFHIDFQVAGPWYLHTNAHLTHYSNAGTQMPNLGLNVIGFGAGVLRKFGQNERNPGEVKSDDRKADNRFGADLSGGAGISEYGTPGGPKLPTQYYSIGIYRSFSPFLRFYTGFEYEYSESVFQFYYQDFESKKNARQRATATSAYLTTELMHDRFAFRFQKGIYLPYPELTRDKTPVYFKLHLLTYAGNTRWKIRPYGGILLKTHLSVAQYMGIVVGLRY